MNIIKENYLLDAPITNPKHLVNKQYVDSIPTDIYIESESGVPMPIGMIITTLWNKDIVIADSGIWLKCNGQEFDETGYSELFDLLGKNNVPIIPSEEGASFYVKGQHGIVLNKDIIGVMGTLERKALIAGTWTKIKFIPTEGNISDINENGEWICSKNGVYTFSLYYGTPTNVTAGNLALRFVKNGEYDPIAGYARDTATNVFVTLNCTIKLKKGDSISLEVIHSVAQAINNNQSHFTIILNSSIDISTWNLYEQWKEQDISRKDISFDEWMKNELKGKDGELMYYDVYKTNEEILTNKYYNGKPVYRRTIDCGLIPQCKTAGTYVEKNIPYEISDLEQCIGINAIGIKDGSIIPMTYYRSNGTAFFYVDNNIRIANSTIAFNDYLVFITIEYTKTIDIALSFNQIPVPIKGDKGKSAYEIAIDNGFEGTEEEWLESIKGKDGEKGSEGAQGPKGATGATGLQGIQGLKGDPGVQGIQGLKGDKGDTGTVGNTELIFKGEANNASTTYTVTQSLTKFKFIITEAAVSNDPDYTCKNINYIPIDAIAYNNPMDLQVYFYGRYKAGVTDPNLEAWIGLMFLDTSRFSITMTHTGTGYWLKLAITRIWGVY